MTSGVYKITNLVSGKIYIGSSYQIEVREKEHFKSLKKNSHSNKHLQRAFNKYGEENFKFEILEKCLSDREILIEREQFYIDNYHATGSNGYNISPSAYSTKGYKHTKESKEKLSKLWKGRKQTEEHIRKRCSSYTGKSLSLEHKRKISEGILNSAIAMEARRNNGASSKGRITSYEVKKKISKSLLHHSVSKETIEKIRNTKRRKSFCGRSKRLF